VLVTELQTSDKKVFEMFKAKLSTPAGVLSSAINIS